MHSAYWFIILSVFNETILGPSWLDFALSLDLHERIEVHEELFHIL